MTWRACGAQSGSLVPPYTCGTVSFTPTLAHADVASVSEAAQGLGFRVYMRNSAEVSVSLPLLLTLNPKPASVSEVALTRG